MSELQLREIHIDGFGVFGGKKFLDLKPGINVIYGPNEFGKSTLLEFLRRLLFGFPRRSPNTNSYPALMGGQYGGHISCVLDNGEGPVIIRRTEGKSEGAVTVTVSEKQSAGQAAVSTVLDGISRTLYENVYAFSLEQLRDFDALQSDDVKSRIYGAGLGLGDISPRKIARTFREVSENIFKESSRAKSPKLAKVLEEVRLLQSEIGKIKEGLSEFDELNIQRDKLFENVSKLEVAIQELETTKQNFDTMKKLYRAYAEWMDAKLRLSDLEELPDFSDASLEVFDELRESIDEFSKLITDVKQELGALETRKQQTTYSNEIIELEPKVISLQKSSEQYLSSSEDIVGVKQKRNELAQKIDSSLEKLGEGWNDKRVRDFVLTHEQRDSIRSFQHEFLQLNEATLTAESKLSYRQDDLAKAFGEHLTNPIGITKTLYGLAVVSVLGVGLAFLLSQFLLVVPMIIMLFLTGIAIVILGRQKRQTAPDEFEETLKEKLRKTHAKEEKLKRDWRDFLSSLGYSSALSPEGALEVADAIKELKNQLIELCDLDSRIVSMKDTIDSVRNVHDTVALCFSDSELTNDLISNIDIISRYLEEAKLSKNKKEDLAEQILQVKTKLGGLRKHLEAKNQEMQSCIHSLGAANEEDVIGKKDIWAGRKQLKSDADNNRKLIEQTVGTGDNFDSFAKQLHSWTPERIEVELKDAKDKLEERREQLTQMNRSIGELRIQISKLGSSEKLLAKLSELEMKKQKINDLGNRWIVDRIAEVMLGEAIAKYENSRQPNVLKEAANIFRKITAKKYRKIIKPVDSDDLLIQEDSGIQKGILEMSNGTKEQLYFAMRLGLIAEYEKQKESLPIIMDDILVNFDDTRGPSAIKVLQGFARDRQIIVLTCHNSNLTVYKEFGANEVKIS